MSKKAKGIKLNKEVLKGYIELKEYKAQLQLLNDIRAYVPACLYRKVRDRIELDILVLQQTKV